MRHVAIKWHHSPAMMPGIKALRDLGHPPVGYSVIPEGWLISAAPRMKDN